MAKWNWQDELAKRDARIAELEALLLEACGDLKAYVEYDWPIQMRAAYPDCARKYERDMDLCYRIDAALGETA